MKRIGDPGYAGGWCIHYRAPSNNNETCEAGIRYDSMTGTFATRPCFLDNGKSKPEATECPLLRRPTAEEIKTHEEWVKSRIERLSSVMLAICHWRKENKGKSARTAIECPACKTGTLNLSIAACNGHVHGRCSTEGCVSWKE